MHFFHRYPSSLRQNSDRYSSSPSFLYTPRCLSPAAPHLFLAHPDRCSVSVLIREAYCMCNQTMPLPEPAYQPLSSSDHKKRRGASCVSPQHIERPVGIQAYYCANFCPLSSYFVPYLLPTNRLTEPSECPYIYGYFCLFCPLCLPRQITPLQSVQRPPAASP